MHALRGSAAPCHCVHPAASAPFTDRRGAHWASGGVRCLQPGTSLQHAVHRSVGYVEVLKWMWHLHVLLCHRCGKMPHEVAGGATCQKPESACAFNACLVNPGCEPVLYSPSSTCFVHCCRRETSYLRCTPSPTTGGGGPSRPLDYSPSNMHGRRGACAVLLVALSVAFSEVSTGGSSATTAQKSCKCRQDVQDVAAALLWRPRRRGGPPPRLAASAKI